MTTQTSPIMSIKDTAPLVNKTEASLRWAIHNGTAPPSAVIMGRRVFRRNEVLAWIDRQFEEQNQEIA